LLGRSGTNEIWNYLLLTSFLIVDFSDTVCKGVFVTDFVANGIVKGLASAAQTPRTVFAIAFLSGLLASMTHVFYARRIYRITMTWKSRKWIWAGLIITLLVSAFQFAAATWSGYIGLLPIERWASFNAVPIAWLTSSSAVDVFLCFMLVYYLRSQKSDFQSTNDLLTRWVSITLETGLLPTLVQITDLILSQTYPTLPYHISVNFVLTKTYINCVLVLFNTIQANRENTNRTPSMTTGWKSQGGNKRPQYQGNTSVAAYGTHSGIHVQSDMHTVIDGVSAVELPTRGYGYGRQTHNDFDDDQIINEKKYPGAV